MGIDMYVNEYPMSYQDRVCLITLALIYIVLIYTKFPDFSWLKN